MAFAALRVRLPSTQSAQSPRRASRAALSLWVLVLVANCSTSFGEPARPQRTTRRSMSAEDNVVGTVALARETLEALRAGRVPGGVDHLAAQLESAARREGGGPRALEALRLAADLFAWRFRVARDRSDVDRAVRAYAVLEGQRDETVRCAAIAAQGDLHRRSGDNARAIARYVDYERQCPRGPALASIHATVALLDPALAHAESAVRTPASARGAHGADPTARTADTPRSSLRRVVIDPGHGGSDPGARGPSGTSESEITLDVGRRLAERISATMGIEVLLTRDSDVYVDLETRTRRANDAGADLFVSLHCNSAEHSEGRGVSTYILDATSDRVAARVAVRENGAVESDPLADPEVFRILANLRLIGQGSRSTELAHGIQRSLLATLGAQYGDIVDLGVHPARFHVLVGARMPAVLVEMSFISHPTEEQRLRDPGYRDLLSRALTRALVAYASTPR